MVQIIKESMDLTGIVKTLIATVGVVVVLVSFGTKLGKAEKSIETLCSTVNKLTTNLHDTESVVSEMKAKSARFEGIMGERTQNIQSDVKEMKVDIKTLLENLELAGE